MHKEFNSEKFTIPYKYLLCENSFRRSDMDYVEEYVTNNIPWNLHIEDFYEQYEYKMNKKNKRESIFFKYGDKIKDLLEQEFKSLLSGDYEIVAHKLVEGHHISIHNDSPILGRETHRFVINLNKNYSDLNGGHFYICSERNSNSVEKILRPISNSGFAFEASKNSYHAVGKVIKGNRLSLVYSFWHIGNTPMTRLKIETLINSAVTKFSNEILTRDLEFLQKNNFDKIKLQSNNLINHLTETYSLLKFWNENDLIAELGLFHSILGTVYFKLDSEKLEFDIAHYFHDRPDLLNLIKTYSTFDIAKLGSRISEQEEIFIKVYFANLITSKINARFISEAWEINRTYYTLYSKYLTIEAQNSIKSIIFTKEEVISMKK